MSAPACRVILAAIIVLASCGATRAAEPERNRQRARHAAIETQGSDARAPHTAVAEPVTTRTRWVPHIGEARITLSDITVCVADAGAGVVSSDGGERCSGGVAGEQAAGVGIAPDGAAWDDPSATASLLIDPTSDFTIEMDDDGALAFGGAVHLRGQVTLFGPTSGMRVEQPGLVALPESPLVFALVDLARAETLLRFDDVTVDFDGRGGGLVIRSHTVSPSTAVSERLGLSEPPGTTGVFLLRAKVAALGGEAERSGHARSARAEARGSLLSAESAEVETRGTVTDWKVGPTGTVGPTTGTVGATGMADGATQATDRMMTDWKVGPTGAAGSIGVAGSTRAPGSTLTTDGTADNGGISGELPNPDIIVGALSGPLTSGGSNVAWHENGISAYAMATTSCNIGTDVALWFALPDNRHPVIGQNLYRLHENRFEQIGMAWLKHAFAAVDGRLCCPGGVDCCEETGSTTLGVGCSDPYSASLNSEQRLLGPRSQVNAFTGAFPERADNDWPPRENTLIERRLQVRSSDLDPALNTGALYFAESQYVSPDEAAAGNGENTVSYRRVQVGPEDPENHWNLFFGSAGTVREQAAIKAWKTTDPSVVETEVRSPGEGLFILSAKTYERKDGFWQYEYALFNLNSHCAAASFRVPIRRGSIIREIGFHDVDYHSGERVGVMPCRFCRDDTTLACVADDDCTRPGTCLTNGTCENDPDVSCESNTECPLVSAPCDVIDPSGCDGLPCLEDRGICENDWPGTVADGYITWATTPFDENEWANALWWGSLYNFRFQTNVPPDDATGVIGPFRPGCPELAARTVGPTLDVIDCDGNGIADECDIDCGAAPDCNVAGCGTAVDCNENFVPDRCEPDCNGNGIADACDIRDCPEGELWCADCNGNTVPDECEPDCDDNGIPDSCDVFKDCDGDGLFDCFDLCPCTSPVESCVCPVNCTCFCAGFNLDDFPCDQCGDIDCVPSCNVTPDSCRGGCTVEEADGDWNRDGRVRLGDVRAFLACYSDSDDKAAFVEPNVECVARFDFDGDWDVDAADYVAFFDLLSAPGGE